MERKTQSERAVLKEQITKLEKEKTELKEEVQRAREQKEDGIQEILNENENKLHDILGKVDSLVNKEKKTITAAAIGQEGEDWVLRSLQEAFPSNYKIVLVSADSGVGDISFTVENTTTRIMFEVGCPWSLMPWPPKQSYLE